MKLTPVLLTILLMMVAGSPAAQAAEFGFWVTNLEIQGENVFDPTFDVALEFDENLGFGLSGNHYWNDHFSTELAIYDLDADASILLGFIDERIDAGKLEITPVTLMLQYHTGGDNSFDFYIGGGAAFVYTSDLSSDDLTFNDLGPITIDDEFTWGANAGISWDISEHLGFGIEGKWIPLDLDGVGPDGTVEKLEIDPLIISAGLLYRF